MQSRAWLGRRTREPVETGMRPIRSRGRQPFSRARRIGRWRRTAHRHTRRYSARSTAALPPPAAHRPAVSRPRIGRPRLHWRRHDQPWHPPAQCAANRCDGVVSPTRDGRKQWGQRRRPAAASAAAAAARIAAVRIAGAPRSRSRRVVRPRRLPPRARVPSSRRPRHLGRPRRQARLDLPREPVEQPVHPRRRSRGQRPSERVRRP